MKNTAVEAKQPITEEMNFQDDWYQKAKKMTAENLPAFIEELDNYQHDYGTICHACAAAAIAAAQSVNHGPQGGITGFQAGAVMWEFVAKWMHKEGPMALLDYDDLLYPQNEYKFNEISQETWEWVQDKAKVFIDSKENARLNIIKHWQSIVDGKIPFGLKVRVKR